MARQKKSKIISIITWLLLLLLLVGGIGAICHFAGIGKDDITDIVNPVFRIEYNSNVYKTDTENVIALPKDGRARFEVKGTKSYSAVIVPNVTTETDFTYTVNGKVYPYSGEKDLSKAFDIKCYDNAFTVTTDGDYTLENILFKIWGVETVTISEHGDFPLYKLIVTSSSGEIVEMLISLTVTGITLPANIVF